MEVAEEKNFGKIAAVESLAHLPTAEIPATNPATAQEHEEFLKFDTDRKVKEADKLIIDLAEEIDNLEVQKNELRQHKEPGWQGEIRKLDDQIAPLREQINALHSISWTASQLEVRKSFLERLQSELGQLDLGSAAFQKQAEFIETLESEILTDQHTLEQTKFLPENLQIDTETIYQNLESAENLLDELQTSLAENPPATKAERFTILGQIRDLENRIPILRGEVARRVKEQNPGRPSLRSLTPLEKSEPKKTMPSLKPAKTVPSLSTAEYNRANPQPAQEENLPVAEEYIPPAEVMAQLPLREMTTDILEVKIEVKEGLITKLRDQIEFGGPDVDRAQLKAEVHQAELDLAAAQDELEKRGVAVTEFVYQPSRWAQAEKAKREKTFHLTGTLPHVRAATPREITTPQPALQPVRALPGTKHTREMRKVVPFEKPKKPTLFQRITNGLFGRRSGGAA